MVSTSAKLKHLSSLAAIIEGKLTEQFGFRLKDTSFDNVVNYMYAPKDSASLAVTRILFGVLMLLDIPDERGGAALSRRWGAGCRFPLLPALTAIPLPYMALVYAALWLGAFGIALGYKYRISCITFTVCYWYLFLIEKSYWNNHSYLFGLVATLLTTTDAGRRWSLDVYLDPSKLKRTVPYWNYFVLKYQFFILYFMAGLKKGTAEWLTGYSVQKLSEHWVFSPFRLFLTVDQTDYLIVHWFIFVFDLTVAFWMMWGKSRPVAMVFCALFHLMNSRLFTIGMFPWVCLATMPLFCPFDWPITLNNKIRDVTLEINKYVPKIICRKVNEDLEPTKLIYDDSKSSEQEYKPVEESNKINKSLKKKSDNSAKNNAENNEEEPKQDGVPKNESLNGNGTNKVEVASYTYSRKVVVCLIGLYVFIQAFLPYSHFITKGYNNWTNGLYGYSWDMMVQTWDIDSVVVKIIDNESQEELFIDPYAYTPNDRWTRHGDMVLQYAACVRDKLKTSIDYRYSEGALENPHSEPMNISIYIDVWCSMNGRFTQRMFNPNVDLLKVDWCPFKPITFLMPLIDEGLHWRETLKTIKEDIQAYDNATDVIFIADFPGYKQEKYTPTDLDNVTLTVMSGLIAYELEESEISQGQSYVHMVGDEIRIVPGTFHKVLNIGNETAFYMYTFKNLTEINTPKNNTNKPKLPIHKELCRRFKDMFVFGRIVSTSTFHIVFGTPIYYE
ncbi:vitamin K-dependent gamma-carboxylase [Aricia agestis]|uniref:vitamin K-dependent gamma-carboxylase n=1 Tax=Aricia agestis TaxID=91739 RepID=UPI001C20AB85|nr:vitamin K-dependent gamma-carboxylase [Aricia agestis]